MKYFLPFLLWFAPLVSVQAANHSFWRSIQLHGAFGMKADFYKVHMSGMHPGRQDGEMEFSTKPIDGIAMQSYLIRWHHAPSIYFERDKDKDDLEENTYDPKSIFGFTGKGITLAAQLWLSTDLRQLRIGGGADIRWSFLKKMAGQWVNGRQSDGDQNEGNRLLNYIPGRSYYFTWAFLFRLGFKLIENQNYTILIDGTWTPSFYNFSELDRDYYWIYWYNFDLGATWEKEITRYMSWNLRVAYGVCLNNEIMEDYEPSSPDHLIHISHYIGGIMAQVGISIRLPLPGKCPIVGCRAKLDHKHSEKHYRGDSHFSNAY